MKKDPLIYIGHISDCIKKVKEYTLGFDEARFFKESVIQDAVIRNFEIIGEAAKHLDKEFRIKYPEIDWKKISGMRDKLIHDYIQVDLSVVWGVIEQILPELERQIIFIINSEK